jgi:uncharacterized protein YcfJ
MNKKSATLMLGCLTLALSSQASARWGDSYVDTARVVSAIPIYETVEINRPVERCYDERVVQRRSPYHRNAGTLVGGIIGGVLGSRVGDGRGRTAATVAGTLVGASVGRNLDYGRDGSRRVGYERRCELVDSFRSEEQLVGYRVKYRYKGKMFETRTDEHPGERIPVRVDVDPLERY